MRILFKNALKKALFGETNMKTQDAHGKKNTAPQRFRRLNIIASVLAITMIGFGGAGRAEEPVTTVTFWELTGHAKDLMIELVDHFNCQIAGVFWERAGV